MHDFDIIICMEGYNLSHRNPLICNLKANKMMSKGLLCNLESVNYVDNDIPSINSVPLVGEFQDVFYDDLPRVAPPRQIDFSIDIEPDTKQLSIPRNRMAPAELKELKLQLVIRVSFSQAYHLEALQCCL